jgi:hypothetical protein
MRRRSAWRVFPVVAFAVSIATAAHAAPATDVGVVRSATGNWLVDERPLVAGRTVPAGGVVRLDDRNSDPNAAYTILIYGAAPVTCSAHDSDCSKKAVLPQQASATPFIKRLIYLVCSRFAGATPKEPDVRGGDEEALRDAVVAPQGTRLSLRAATEAVAPGSYAARFVPLDAAGAPSGAAVVVKLTVDRDTSVDASSLPPRLYALSLLATDGTRVVSNEAWVLVTDRARYADRSAEFADAVKMTSAWPSDQRDGARAFLHEALAVLASTSA